VIKRSGNDTKQHVHQYPAKKKRTQHTNMDVRQKLVLHTVALLFALRKKCKKRKKKI